MRVWSYAFTAAKGWHKGSGVADLVARASVLHVEKYVTHGTVEEPGKCVAMRLECAFGGAG